MKPIFLLAVILALQATIAKAQDSTINLPEFGKIAIAELQIKECNFSPGAAAINLLKYKTVELDVFPNGNTEVVTLTRYRIKILRKNGYKNATIILPFYADNPIKTKNIQAATYNIGENGQVEVTSVKEDDIFKTEGTKKYSQKSIKFTFPNVKEGSILEYQVTQNTRWYMMYPPTISRMIFPMPLRFTG